VFLLVENLILAGVAGGLSHEMAEVLATQTLAAGATGLTYNWPVSSFVQQEYAGDKLVRRFIKIDKLTTAMGTDDNKPRPYRYGYGVLDENFNMQADPGEKKVYFEISDYATNYVFFESPR
jgi:hypothetical protein